MPSSIVTSFAKKSGESVAKVEKLWDEIKTEVKKEYTNISDKSERFYKLVTGILKKRLKLEDIEISDVQIRNLVTEELKEESTLSTDIATKPNRMGTVQKRVEPDDYIGTIPVFDVDGNTFMKASKMRSTGSRYGIQCEKFNMYLRENGYRCSAAIRWNGNLLRIK